jgi:hypothetical protein
MVGRIQLPAAGIRAIVAYRAGGAASCRVLLQCSAMKTRPAAGAKPQAVLEELMQREPVFHRLEQGSTRADLERMTDAEFSEVGASGRRYGRDYVLDLLEKRFANPGEDVWECSDSHCLELARDTYLVTYTLLQQQQRKTRRASIWRRSPQGWQVVYHQGTVVEAE